MPVDEAGPGEICAVAGLPEITIGETLADVDDPRPLPVIHVDDPSIGVTIATSTSPFAGKDGNKLTARQIQARLDQELIGNVSIRVEPTERPDAWEVQGRGELQLAVLVETMRREGFELLVGQPRVVTREIDGVVHEPMERMSIDVPEEYVGVGHPDARAAQGPHGADDQPRHGLGPHGLPRAGPRPDRLPHRVPHRDARHRHRAQRVRRHASRGTASCARGPPARWSPTARARSPSYSCFQMQERGSLFVSPGDEVYDGMVIGENARADDLDVNIVREKHLTNVRSSTADELERLVPAAQPVARPGDGVAARGRVRRGDAEGRPDPQVELDPNERTKAARRAKAGAAPR